jgi:cellulose synthase/poly-beta-1,6-N-acetylglucosamine synthase-like glycosyltransferase
LAFSKRLSPWQLVLLQAVTGALAEINYRRLPTMRVGASDHGTVAVIVPARNEAKRLPDLLLSLHRLMYPNVEILVVDDGSTDGTAAVAAECGARVLKIAGPDPGWTGKNFACWKGAHATAGDWILFTDADTIHGPDSLSSALETASAHASGLFSLLPRQRCVSFWERLLLPYAYALYFAGTGGANAGGAVVANGQYMLFRRSDYQRIGGHESVRGSLIEDVALAHRAHDCGLSVLLARGDDHVEVRMYESFSDLAQGFTKNSARFLAANPRSGWLTILASIGFLSALPSALRARSPSMGLALLCVPFVSLLRWNRRFGVPVMYSALFPLAALAFQAIALASIRVAAFGGATWKGRRY